MASRAIRAHDVHSGTPALSTLNRPPLGSTGMLDSLFALLDRTPGLVMITDLKGNLLYMNVMGRTMLGLGKDKNIAGHAIADSYSAHSYELMLEQAIPTALRDGAWRGDATLIDRQLREIPVSQVMVFHRPPGKTAGMLLSIAWDMSDQRRKERNLWHQATHDALTGLPNQALLMDRLQQEIYSAQRNAQRTAVLFLDLDCFKSINDEFGHENANQVLAELAARMSSCVRAADTVGRYGGDEFVFILCHLNESADITPVLSRIQAALDQPFLVGDEELYLSASIGVAVHPGDGHDARSLLHHADMKMHRAKERHAARRCDAVRLLRHGSGPECTAA